MKLDYLLRPITGVAWLSSARVVRCKVKWGNERNPVLQVLHELASLLANLDDK